MSIRAYFENIKEKIIEEIKQSSDSISVAVAWFTDKEIFEELVKKAKDSVKVEILILDDQINNSSYINFETLTLFNGKVYKIEEKERKTLMHNKFCVIDNHTVITGSYNWSYKARINHENITILKNDNSIANKFNIEFRRIIKFYFPNSNSEISSDKRSTEIISYSKFSEALLESELQLLKINLLGLENEIIIAEKAISNFATMYEIALGPAILKLLKLNKKISNLTEKDELRKNDAEQEFRDFKKSYNNTMAKGWKDLTKEESKELKTIFRKASKLCHPDLVADIEKDSAESIFNELRTMHELNDLEGIKRLYNHLEQGVFTKLEVNIENFKNRKLKEEINKLRIKLESLEDKLSETRNSKTYITLKNISNLEEYFSYMKSLLQYEIEEKLDIYEKELASNI